MNHRKAKSILQSLDMRSEIENRNKSIPDNLRHRLVPGKYNSLPARLSFTINKFKLEHLLNPQGGG